MYIVNGWHRAARTASNAFGRPALPFPPRLGHNAIVPLTRRQP